MMNWIRKYRLKRKYRKYSNSELIKMLGDALYKVDLLIQCRMEELSENEHSFESVSLFCVL